MDPKAIYVTHVGGSRHRLLLSRVGWNSSRNEVICGTKSMPFIVSTYLHYFNKDSRFLSLGDTALRSAHNPTRSFLDINYYCGCCLIFLTTCKANL